MWAARALRDRRQRRRPAAPAATRPRPVQRLGRARRRRRAEGADGPLPPRDRYEGNDEAGNQAFALYGRSIDIKATLDYWDDNIDVYRIRLKKGQTVAVSLQGPARHRHEPDPLAAGHAAGRGSSSARLQARRVTQSARAGPNEHFLHRAPRGGLVLRRGQADDARLGRVPAAHLEEPRVIRVGVQLPEVEREVSLARVRRDGARGGGGGLRLDLARRPPALPRRRP